MKVVVIGGGWFGCVVVLSVKKVGVDVIIIEKIDFLFGFGNVGGIMRNNGRFIVLEEFIVFGCGDLI